MDLEALRAAVRAGRLEWQRHALERMVERGLARAAVREVLLTGEIIEEYPRDHPLPSALFLGRPKGRPLHVVAALDAAAGVAAVITVYEPDAEHFAADFRTRRKR